jgi:hypothetical protein
MPGSADKKGIESTGIGRCIDCKVLRTNDMLQHEPEIFPSEGINGPFAPNHRSLSSGVERKIAFQSAQTEGKRKACGVPQKKVIFNCTCCL